MARSHGRFSRLYVATASGGTASPLTAVGTWEIALSTDKVDVTALTDTNKQYVTGLPDGTISYSGFSDDTASSSLIAAALDGVKRKVYAYPFSSDSIYFFGEFFFDTTWSTDVNGAVAQSGQAMPAGAIGKVGF